MRTAETRQASARPGTATIQHVRRPIAGQRRMQVSAATKIVIAVACTISVAAYLHFYSGGKTILYGDAKCAPADRTPGALCRYPRGGQLGGVWLPLPHILMLPLIWNNWAYYSGFAGSAVMMVAYVVCTVFIYKFIWHLTYRHWAAACGTAVFALDPNVLYMQSTPMTRVADVRRHDGCRLRAAALDPDRR